MTTDDGPRTTDVRNASSRRLTIEELQAIRRVIARGTRHTEIARSMNLSLWTIDRIAVEQRCGIDPPQEDELPVDDAPANYEAKNLRRCGGCGAMVYVWPCVACLMAVKQRVPAAREVEDNEGESGRVGERVLRRTKRNAVYRVKMARKAG